MWDEFYQLKGTDTWHTIDPEGMMNDFSCVHWVFDDDDDEGWGGVIEPSFFTVWFGVESPLQTMVSTLAF